MPETTTIRLQFRPMRLRDALKASHWRYPGEYAIYDLGLAPLLFYALLRAPLRAFGVYPLVVATPNDPLISVFSLISRGDDIELGVGMRPDLMGHGLGLALILQGMDFARQRLRPNTFSLSVATFNQRAITVYERAGFQPGPRRPFYANGKRYESLRMTRPA
jgi:[ribosomal protein S18]-alanine N-acetyltransferase